MILAVLGTCLSFQSIAAAQAVPPIREVNVTADSTPGWTPSVEQERLAKKAATDYLAALDAGRSSDAYVLLSERNRSQSTKAFAANLAEFNSLAGPAKARRFTKTHGRKILIAPRLRASMPR